MSVRELRDDEEEGSQRTIDIGRRWQILGLLFLIALINYFDRQSLSVVAPRLQAELHLSDVAYGHIVSLFLAASAIAYATSGFLCDLTGTRWGMTIFVAWWSMAEAMTAFCRTAMQLSLARFCLGLGEPGLWVAAPKAVGESFPARDRGLAIGVYTMGATAGAVVAVPIITGVTAHWPWKTIFWLDGLAGLLWIPLWLWIYRSRPVTRNQAIPSLNARRAISQILSQSKTWRLLIARALTDPVWYFFLFWFPKYLFSIRHLSPAALGRIGWIVYLGAGTGTLLGGLLSGHLIRIGSIPTRAYRTAMLLAALLVPVSPLAALISNTSLAIVIAAIVALAHMAWLVNLTATVVDVFSPQLVGRAAGLIAAGSALGGMLSSELVAGTIVRVGYTPIFCTMAFLHPIALLILWPAFRDLHSSDRSRSEEWPLLSVDAPDADVS